MAQHRIILYGYGRMGREIHRLAEESGDLSVVGICSRSQVDSPLATELQHAPEADVAIDFSLAAATGECLAWARERNLPVVCGTTGLDEATRQALESAAESIPLFYARNMSLGVHLMTKAVAMVAAALGDSAEAEILEKHHTGKIDVPSGTASALAEAITKARLSSSIAVGRPQGHEARKSGEVTIHSVRLGNIPGEHEACFAFGEEELSILHRAGSRAIFAAGALRAARFLVGQKPGLYGMDDLVG